MSSSAAMREHRARVGALSRSRSADDPALLSARQSMLDEVLVDTIQRALDRHSPPTDSVRGRIIALVSGGAD